MTSILECKSTPHSFPPPPHLKLGPEVPLYPVDYFSFNLKIFPDADDKIQFFFHDLSSSICVMISHHQYVKEK